jgi:hypothetical protein
MEEQDVRARAEALCAALVGGDVDRAMADVSDELRRNLGEVISLFPLPATDAQVASIERGGSSAFVAVLELVGETETVQVQTRWKERDGHPTLIEASHLSRVEIEGPIGDEDEGDEANEANRTPA